jgi:hypothetical protein
VVTNKLGKKLHGGAEREKLGVKRRIDYCEMKN